MINLSRTLVVVLTLICGLCLPASAQTVMSPGTTAETEDSDIAPAVEDVADVETAPEELTPEEEGHQALQNTKILEARIESLDQALKGLAEAQTSDEQAILELGERLEVEFQRIDPIAIRIDGLAESITGTDGAVEVHDDQIRDNAGQIYDLLIRINEISEQSGEFSERLQKQEIFSTGTQGASSDNESSDAHGTLIALSIGLILLGPIGFALLMQSRYPMVGAASVNSRIAATWAGGALGFAILGAGIITGPGQSGFLGDPTAALAWFFGLGEDGLFSPALFAAQLGICTLAALIICSALPLLTTTTVRFLIAFGAGALLIPVAQHWTFADAHIPGWLALNRFQVSGAAEMALLAGSAAMIIRTQFGPEMFELREPEFESPAGTFLLWGCWIGAALLLSASVETILPVIGSVLMGGAGAILLLLLAARMFGIRSRWNSRLGLGANAGMIAGPGAMGGAPVELLVAGALAALVFLALRTLRHVNDPVIEIISAITAGGLIGVIAPGLLTENGLIGSFEFSGLVTQMTGLVALVALAVLFAMLTGFLMRKFSTIEPLPGAAAS